MQPKISFWQWICSLSGALILLAFFVMPTAKSDIADSSDIWLSLIIAIPYMIVILSPIIILSQKYKTQSLNALLHMSFGNGGAKLSVAVFTLYLILSNALHVITFALFAQESLFPNGEKWVLILLIGLPSVYSATKGIGTICRINSFFFIMLLFSIIVFAVFGIEELDFHNILPIGKQSSFLKLNIGALLLSLRNGETVIHLVFNRNLAPKTNRYKLFAVALLLIEVFGLIIVLQTILVLGFEYTNIVSNPYLILMRQVKFYGSVERMQAIGVFFCIPAYIMRSALHNAAVTSLINEEFPKLPKKIVPVAFGFVPLLFLFIPAFDKSYLYGQMMSGPLQEIAAIMPLIIIPLAMLIVLHIKNRKRKSGMPQILQI